MANETETATSQPSTEKSGKGDGSKSSNVTVDQVTQHLLKREAALIKDQPTSENVAKADKPAGETAPTSEAAETKTASETPAETKVEAAETKVEQAEAKLDEALSQEASKEDPKTQDKLQRRIAELVKERNQAQAEAERVKAEYARKATQLPPPAPTPDNPLANIEDLASLTNERDTARKVKKWAREQLDRDSFPAEGVSDGAHLYTKEQVKAILRNTEEMLEEIIPNRARFLDQRAKVEQNAMATFPWLKEPDSPEYARYQQYVRDPIIAKQANAPWIAALIIQGDRTLRESIAAESKGAKPVDKVPAKERAPASQTAAGAAPGPAREPSGTVAMKRLTQEVQRLKEKGNVSVKDVSKYFAQKESINR
jgi:hypothetical protein